MIPMWKGKNPVYFAIIRSKVKVTVTRNVRSENRVVSHDNFSSVYCIFKNLATWFPCETGIILYILRSLVQRSRSLLLEIKFWQLGRFCMITLVLYIWSLTILTIWFSCGRGNNPIYFGVIRSKVKVTVTIIYLLTTWSFLQDNFNSIYLIFNKLGHMIVLWKRKNPIFFGVIRSKVKVTVTMNIIFDSMVVSAR